jgi:aryl-alcohol dehydrogenase-like predicted oxidoreductase
VGRQPSLASTLRVCPEAAEDANEAIDAAVAGGRAHVNVERAKASRSSEIAKRHGATSAQIALAWLLRRSPAMLPIPGTLSLGHLRENLAALEIELTDAKFDALR